MREQIILMGMDILQPAVALMIWTMIIWAWMYATRIPAMQKANIDAQKLVGSTGAALDQTLPPEVQWKAHNYNHLHEAPTVFYAVAIVLAILGQGDGMNALLGWIYTGLRVAHSLVQVTANRVMVRFVLFLLSSIVLIALIFSAASTVFGAGTELQGDNLLQIS
ncbi:MAG: MAPEG family protein [Pseudomonadota bacterium]